MSLKDFWDDHSLSADPRNLIAAVDRSAPPWVILPRNCDGDCLALIPYHVDRVCTLGLYWDGEDDWGTYAVLTDDQGGELAVIEPGRPEVGVAMHPGDYVITLYRAQAGVHDAVYIQPDPDTDRPLFRPDVLAYPERLLFFSGKCPECNLSGGNLLQASLSNNDLTGADLSGTNLLNAWLESTCLVKADLDGANMFQTRLKSADLRGASLAGANVFQSDFSEVDLNGVEMPGINAPEACFFKADLREADISGAILGYINGIDADFSGARLRGSILTYSVLTGAVFVNADLRETDFTGAYIDGADFTGADLTGATWVDGSYCDGPSVESCRADALE